MSAGPAGYRVPVVAECPDAELTHRLDLRAQPGDLLIAAGAAQPDGVHRRGIFDDRQLKSVVLVRALQPSQRGAFPGPFARRGNQIGRRPGPPPWQPPTPPPPPPPDEAYEPGRT